MEKTRSSDLTIPLLIFVDGLIFILTALFAFEIGLDPDETMGRTRFMLLMFGVGIVLISQIMIVLQYRKVDWIEPFLTSETIKTGVMMFHMWGGIFLIYVWFITYGTFTKWDRTSNYYSQLADGFNNGQLYLEVQPSAEILAASDPYNPENRPRQEAIWDMSLYKGRIYLYWGPLPALLIAPLQLIFNVKILEIYIDFFFYACLLIVNSLILMKLRNNYFPSISSWNAMICIALIGLISPVLWALIPTTIYGTAIGVGHFFLMGGIYFILAVFDQGLSNNSKRMRLFIAGLLLTCSMGTRALNAPSILFLAVLVAIWIAKLTPRPFRWSEYIKTITPLFIPLAIGVIATGWYNWARFDSPLEFGLHYQISFFNFKRDLGLTFQPDYFLLNLYAYFLQPFVLIPRFPFVIPSYTASILAQNGIELPKMYFAGRMTGLVFGAPFLFLGLVHIFKNKHAVMEGKTEKRDPIYDFMIYCLAGSSLIGFLSFMFYFFGQMRYLVDIISQITILAILGYWRLVSIRQKTSSIFSRVFVSISNILILLTICISLLLAVTNETSRMEKANPELLDKIANALMFDK